MLKTRGGQIKMNLQSLQKSTYESTNLLSVDAMTVLPWGPLDDYIHSR